MAYEQDLARIQAIRPGTRKEDVVPASLVTGTALVNGSNLIQFLVNKGDKQALPYENLIDKTDAFAITRYGLFLINEIVGNEGKAELQTYPNIIQFPASDTGLVAADLMKVYNGFLNIQVGQAKILESYPTHNFKVARTTQQASATTFSEYLPVDGFATADPMLILDGSQKNLVSILRPATSGEGVQLTSTTSKIVKAVFFAQGYVIYGGARN